MDKIEGISVYEIDEDYGEVKLIQQIKLLSICSNPNPFS